MRRPSFPAAAALVLLCAVASIASERPPNVIFIFADDSGYADFGCYGHPYAKTPNIDRLAAEGTRFMQFYVTGVTCCPSRTGFMTSRWPASYHDYPAHGGLGDRATITQLLKQHGYATGHFGKWHIGPTTDAGTYGIDEIQEGAPLDKGEHPRGRDAAIYDRAIQFVEDHKDGPFYMNVWSHISHHRISPPASYVERFKDMVVDESKFAAPMREKFAACKARGGDVSEHMRRYLADINSMDEDIGRLLARIDELGLRENTIVVFSSDQGAAPVSASADKDPERRRVRQTGKDKASPADASAAEYSRLDAMGYNGPFRGGKHTVNEGGVRVPFIVRWPGHVSAGRTDEKSVTSGIDWLPTLCRIAGAAIDAADFEGEDVSAAWFGNATHMRTKPLLWKTSAIGSDAAIRDGKWKLFIPTRKNGIEVQLYDMDADATETRNLAQTQPEVVQRLRAKLESWIATLPKDYIKADDGDK